MGVNNSVKTSLAVIRLRVEAETVCLMTGALPGMNLEFEVEVQDPLSVGLGRAALDDNADLIPYARVVRVPSYDERRAEAELT